MRARDFSVDGAALFQGVGNEIGRMTGISGAKMSHRDCQK